MLRRHAVLIAALAFLAATPLLAQNGPNGGLVGGTGSHKTELVVSPTELTVYLLEDGKPHETKGTTMRAVIQQAGKTAQSCRPGREEARRQAARPARKGGHRRADGQGRPRPPAQCPLRDQVATLDRGAARIPSPRTSRGEGAPCLYHPVLIRK
jgi:hypothetical protein